MLKKEIIIIDLAGKIMLTWLQQFFLLMTDLIRKFKVTARHGGTGEKSGKC